MKQFSDIRTEAHSDMLARKQKLLNRSNDAYSKGDLPTMRKAHSLAMKQDSRTRAKYPDEERKRVMSGANKDILQVKDILATLLNIQKILMLFLKNFGTMKAK